MIEHVRKAAQCLACREDTLAERLKLARSEVAIVMIQPDLVPDDLRPRLVEIAR